MTEPTNGFAKAGNRYPPRVKCGAGFFRIMLYCVVQVLAIAVFTRSSAPSMSPRS
jgi:hypothetical protein